MENTAPTTVNEEPNADNAQPRVLVLESDLFFAVRIEKTLQKQGYRVEVVDKSETAVERARETRPTLVIINYGGTHLNPEQTTRDLKALPHPPRVLGFVSHTWIPQVRPNAMQAGADLLVANSALALRLPHLAAKLAPLNGGQSAVPDASEYPDEEEGK